MIDIIPDCDICKNRGSYLCNDCEYQERHFEDHFEPDPVKAAEWKEKEKRELEDSLEYEIIPVEVTKEFRETVEALKSFNGLRLLNKKFIPIHAGDDFLSATNTHMLAKITCPVPAELQGRNIIRFDPEGVRVYKGQAPWAGQEDSLAKRDNKIEFDIVVSFDSKELGQEGLRRLKLPGVDILLNSEYLDMARGILRGDLSLYYKGKLDAVTLEGENGFVVIMPIRE